MTESNRTSSSDDSIGKLIASAGPGSTATPAAKQRIYDAVHARWQSGTVGRQKFHAARRYRAIGIAAAVALTAITVYWLQDPQLQRSTDQAAAQLARVEGGVELLRADGSSQRLATDTAGTIQFGDTLRTSADGLVAMRLNGDLELRINVASELVFAAADEIELVTGTIYVDTGGAAQPLLIDTQLGDIAHLGTQYEVHVSDSALRLRVREGSVAYTGTAASEIGQAGEQLDIDSSGLLASRSTVAPNDSAWEWAASLATLPLSDEYRVNEVLEWVARELGLQLDYASFVIEQRLTNQTLVGLEGLNPKETLDVIQRMTNIATEISNDQLSIGT